MPLPTGTKLGSYDIGARIGAGGMGEVYRATDARLGRDVALKVLPDAVALDPERLGRFEREAKVLASLTHPNIATLYALEQLGGRPVLVMELAAGHDLTEVISRGPMPLDDLLPLATQIALALEAAHEKGIVHRDLKPANVKVSDAGITKVLDFGLAKAFVGDPSSANAMNSPTLTANATAMGVILGTAAYMSPEQARGRAADKRADIWSFGVVLYEMLTGARLFEGETISDTIAAVLRETPDWTKLPAGIPPELTRLLRRCLERDPRNRLHDIGDARIVLEEIARGGPWPEQVAARPVARATQPAWRIAGIVALALLIGAVGGLSMPGRQTEAATAAPLVQMSVLAPAGITYVDYVTIAPDGSFVVFVGTGPGISQLFMRRLEDATAVPIERTEGAMQPFISPDSKWIGFAHANHLEKIAVSGGEPIRIADVTSDSAGNAWGPDGTILVNTSWYSGLFAVSADGGPLREITKVDAAHGERGHWFPQFLPDGRHVLFTIFRAATGLNDAQVAVLDLSTGAYHVIMPGAHASYIAPGFLVFYRAGAYQAVRFDLQSLKPAGSPVTVLSDTRGITPDGSLPHFSASANGTIVHVPGANIPTTTINWIAEGAKTEPLPFAPRAYSSVSLSPNARQVAAGVLEGGGYVIRLLDLDRRTDDAIDLPGNNWLPHWNPDGRRISILSMRKGDYDVYGKDITSTAPPVPLLVTPFDESAYAWLSDKKLLVTQSDPDGRYRGKLVDLDAPDRPTVLSERPDLLTVSPDGRWLAIADTHTGRSDVYIRPLAGDGAAQRVTTNGGTMPLWSKNGRELYYARDHDIFALSLREDGSRMVVERERVWAHVNTADPMFLMGVGLDGRILALLPQAPPLPTQVRIIVNWQQELRRLLAR